MRAVRAVQTVLARPRLIGWHLPGRVTSCGRFLLSSLTISGYCAWAKEHTRTVIVLLPRPQDPKTPRLEGHRRHEETISPTNQPPPSASVRHSYAQHPVHCVQSWKRSPNRLGARPKICALIVSLNHPSAVLTCFRELAEYSGTSKQHLGKDHGRGMVALTRPRVRGMHPLFFPRETGQKP